MRHAIRRGILLGGIGLCCSPTFLMSVPVADAHQAQTSKQPTRSCGRLKEPGTPYPAFTIRAYRMSCSSARTLLLAWAKHPRNQVRRGSSAWHCHVGSETRLWFSCTSQRGRAIAEAFHVPSRPSSVAPPKLRASRGAGEEPGYRPRALNLSLSTQQPVIGQEITVTINNPIPGVTYQYERLACSDAAGINCTVLEVPDSPTIIVGNVCGSFKPYYLQAGALRSVDGQMATEVGLVTASTQRLTNADINEHNSLIPWLR
jgi:hypothetical protein